MAPAFVEMRWLEWGFEGRETADPWGDDRDGRWYVAPEETVASLVEALDSQARRSRAVVEAHELSVDGTPARAG